VNSGLHELDKILSYSPGPRKESCSRRKVHLSIGKTVQKAQLREIRYLVEPTEATMHKFSASSFPWSVLT
jgi:hypothetical protein